MTAASTYIMDDPREGQRLLDKADPGTWIAKFLAPHFPHAKSVLSVGCGPGVFLREIAESHPEIEVVGIDISPKRIADAEHRLAGLPNARVCLGDALSIPFEANRFDLVFCRFLLEYLPDKPLAVREMTRVCTLGGKLLLQDLDGQLVWHFPEDTELQQTTERVVGQLAATGFDPFVGRKLFSLCVGGGLKNVKVQLDPYHLYAGTIDEAQFSQWRTKLEIARPQIAAVLGDKEAADRYSERFLAYLKNPDTLTYSCLFTVTGTKLS
jgi:SAM-dependent methyltransferase